MALLTACTDTVEVQRRYSDVRDECRGQAESTVGNPGEGVDESDRSYNTALATVFSRCMQGRGWTVASPPSGGGNEGPDTLARQNQATAAAPSGSPPQQTSAQALQAAPPAQAVAPAVTPAPRTDLPPGRKRPLENPR